MGMNAGRENRDETIINQDATVLMDAIRNGAQGMDDLTNYVVAITNYVTQYHDNGSPGNFVFGYTYTNSNTTVQFPLTNGLRIIGLLSTPEYIPFNNGKDSGFYSNHVVATVRSFSGAASEKFPQGNLDVQSLGLTYRLISEVVPYGSRVVPAVTGKAKPNGYNGGGFDLDWTNYTAYLAAPYTTNDWQWRSNNYWHLVPNMEANLSDVRLLFRWPLLPTGKLGVRSTRQTFRAQVSGSLTNYPFFPSASDALAYRLYFIQPRTYVMRTTP
jgi:hypothetical protein